ncbi:MAG TPA: DUF721 domain-containing protein [Actinomycetota bacterium]
MAERGPYRRRRSRGEDDRRDPAPLADLLPKLVAGRGWGEPIALGKLRESWAAIVGDSVARRSAPLKLFRGTLTVGAEGGAWASEITLQAGVVAERASAFLARPGAVREVRVVARSRGWS